MLKRANPFQPCKDNFNVIHKFADSEYIIDRELKDVVKKIGDDETEFVIEKKLVETGRKNRIEFVQSFKDDVGIENILRRFELTQDPSVFNVINRHPVGVDENGVEQVIDITGLADNAFDNAQMVAKARAIIDTLPEEDRKAILSLSDADLIAYLKAAKAAESNKDGGSNNE